MKIMATVTANGFTAGVEYDLPDSEAQAAIIAGCAVAVTVAPDFIAAFDRETSVKQAHQHRWRTR